MKLKIPVSIDNLLKVAKNDSFEEELSTEYDPHEHKSDLENGIPEAHGECYFFSFLTYREYSFLYFLSF